MTTHPSHQEHPLKAVNHEGLYTCDGCKMDGKGLRYRCEGCNYDLHHECMFAPPKLTFQEHKCQFLERPLPAPNCTRSADHCTKCRRSCDACGMTVKGFVYHCPKSGWDFHPRCAKLRSKISIGDVTFWLEKQGPSSCAWCKRKLLSGARKKIPGWSYVSKYDDCNFHVFCVMEMAMQSSSGSGSGSGSGSASASTNNAAIGGDSSLAIMQKMKLPLETKSKKGGAISRNKWLEILKIFLSTVFSILLGDPTTIIASTVAHLVTQGLFHQG